MESAGRPDLNAALDRIWAKFLPQMEERMEILERAARSLAGGKLSTDEQIAANAAAHNLAGVLGTFGLTRGTVLARELEILYSQDGGPDPASGAQLASLAAELRTLIETRK